MSERNKKMAVPAKPLSEVTEEGIRLLVRKMGAADVSTFSGDGGGRDHGLRAEGIIDKTTGNQ